MFEDIEPYQSTGQVGTYEDVSTKEYDIEKEWLCVGHKAVERRQDIYLCWEYIADRFSVRSDDKQELDSPTSLFQIMAGNSSFKTQLLSENNPLKPGDIIFFIVSDGSVAHVAHIEENASETVKIRHAFYDLVLEGPLASVADYYAINTGIQIEQMVCFRNSAVS